uniref:Fibroblast growth factor n=1 Tax=Syphacia muris TaxID=451379 RepID=A0A0N5AYY9_9BILA
MLSGNLRFKLKQQEQRTENQHPHLQCFPPSPPPPAAAAAAARARAKILFAFELPPHQLFKTYLLEFISVAIGLVSIRGKESQRYLCMNSDGKLYGCTRNEFSAECIFKEEMLENLFNLYSSCSYGTSEKPWYVALKRDGRPKRGKRAKKKKKSSHFMFVKYDDNRPNEFFENFALLRRQNGAHSRPIRYVEDHGNGKSISELQPLNASIQAMLRALNATKTGGNLVVKQLDNRNIIRNSYKPKQKLTRIQKDNKRREERKKELQMLRMNAKYEGSQRSQNLTRTNSAQQQIRRSTHVSNSNLQQQRFKLGNYSLWYKKWKHLLPDQYKNR